MMLPAGYQEPASRVYGQDVAWRLIWREIMTSTALSVERGVDSDFSKHASWDQCPGAATWMMDGQSTGDGQYGTR